MVDRVQVTVEGLDAKTALHVPQTQSLIGRSGGKDVGVGLEDGVVDGVYVTAEGMADNSGVEIEEFGGVVHGGGDDEVAGVVEVDTPDGLDVVLEGMSATRVDEVPDLDSAIAGRGDQVAALGVEADAGHPVLVALTTHDEVGSLSRDSPDFPREVVGRGCHDGLLGMHGEPGDGHHVSRILAPRRLNVLVVKGVEVEPGVGIDTVVLRERRQLSGVRVGPSESTSLLVLLLGRLLVINFRKLALRNHRTGLLTHLFFNVL